MQYIKQQIQKGNLELAKFDGENKPVPMEYSELEQKKDTQNKRTQILQKLQVLSSDEKAEWIELKKLKAKQLYKAGKYPEAIEVYLETLLGVSIKEDDQLKLRQSNHQFKYPIMLNIATCFFRQREYAKAVELCNKILEEEDGRSHTKAYYKKACSQLALTDYIQVRKTSLQGIQSLNNEESDVVTPSSFKNDFLKLIAEAETKSSSYKSIYQKMFPKEEEEEDDEEEEELLSEGTRSKDSSRHEEILYYRQSWWTKLSGCCLNSFAWTVSIFAGPLPGKEN